MKKIFFFLFIGTILFSCEEDRSDYHIKKNIAYFNSSTGNLPAKDTDGVAGTDYVLRIGSAFTVNYDRTIALEIDAENSTAIEGQHFTIDTSSLVIPANEYSANIVINSNYDNVPADGVKLILNLLSVDNTDLMVSKSMFTLTIYQSCLIPDFPLSYTAFVSAFEDTAPTHQQTFTIIEGAENYFYVQSSWGPNFVGWATGSAANNGQYFYSGNLLINCDNTVVFEGIDSWALGGTGSYDPNTGIITITVGQSLFTTDFTATVTFMPNP